MSPSHLRVKSLDGLRGLAVLLVVVGHLWPGVLPGGFVGVTVFFTLSGYLIASLALDRIGMVGGRKWLKQFVVARVARLAPIGIVTLVIVAVATRWLPQTSGSRFEFLSALGHFVNLYYFFHTATYADGFADPSAIQHYWSLSVEEQFYLVFPFVLLGSLVLARRRGSCPKSMLRIAASVCVAWSVAVAIMSHPGRDYFRTDLRIGEIAVGVFLATVIPVHALGGGADNGPTGGRVAKLAKLGWWIPIGVICGWAFAAQASYRSTYFPGFAIIALASAASILAIRFSDGFRSVIGARPLAWLGTISYGVYLIHWPVLIFVRRAWPTLGSWQVAAVVIAVTLAVAATSFRYFEMPIRRRTDLRRTLVVYPAVAAIAALVFVSVPRVDPGLSEGLTDSTLSPNGRRLPETVVLGDSVGYNVFGDVASTPGRTLWRYLILGCAYAEIDGLGPKRGSNPLYSDSDECRHWRQAVAEPLSSKYLDSIVVIAGFSLSRTMVPVNQGPCSATFGSRYESALRSTMNTLTKHAPVLWVLPHQTWAPAGFAIEPSEIRSSMLCLRETQERVASEFRNITLFDLNTVVCPNGLETCTDEDASKFLKDGIHFRPEQAKKVRSAILGEVDEMTG